jgi:peptidoglycan/xylan/chitin deacetylase (PgdA/CDA1 family)
MKKLTLSFDNGPDPDCTPWVLDILAERGIKSSFFVCAEGNPVHAPFKASSPDSKAILERARSEGHLIGNHTLTHTVELGTTDDPEAPAKEIGQAQELMGDLCENPRLFRPYMSGGILGENCFSPKSIEFLCENKFTTVMFNCVPKDWLQPETWPEQAFKDGEQLDWMLIIVHDVGFTGAMKQLPRFLDECIARGVEIVQEFPTDCTPIVNGEIVGNLDGLVCGDTVAPVSEHIMGATPN